MLVIHVLGIALEEVIALIAREEKQAYADSLQQIAEKPIGTWKFEGCFTVEDGRNVIREWASMSVKPTAFLVSCNHIAAGMVTEAKKQNSYSRRCYDYRL